MKITRQQLKQIIKEEIETTLNEKKLKLDPDAGDIYIDKIWKFNEKFICKWKAKVIYLV